MAKVPFNIDNFGNLICFDANNDKIVFVNQLLVFGTQENS